MKILVTSGATKEPIDSVRFITNMSSGHTGVTLANYFQEKGHDVLLLRGLGSAVPNSEVRSATFVDFMDLDQILKQTLAEEKLDAVIHLAAVSDFSVDWVKIGDETHYGPITEKIDSNESVDIHLKKNFKIVERLKDYAQVSGGKAPYVVSFKLTSGAGAEERKEAISKLYKNGKIDLVVHNDLSEITSETHPFKVVTQAGQISECPNHEILSEILEAKLRSQK